MKLTKRKFKPPTEMVEGSRVRYKNDPNLVGSHFPEACITKGVGTLNIIRDGRKYCSVKFDSVSYNDECTLEYLEVVG